MNEQGNALVQEFKAIPVRAAIWKREVEQNGRTVIRYSIKVEKQYRDKQTGEWKSTTNFFPEDLPKLRLVASEAYRFVTLRTSEDDPDLPTVAR